MKKELSLEDIWQSWLGYLINQQDNRYTRNDRKEHLEVLIQYLHSHGASEEDAGMFQTEAMKAITTEIGRKGKGHHKGWKQNCLDDFKGILKHTYSPINKAPETNGALNVNIAPFKADPGIDKWVKSTYGDSDVILQQAHVFGNMYNLLYLDFLDKKVS